MALSTYYGGLMKFDKNGNIKLSKFFADPYQPTLTLLFLQTISMVTIGENDITINGRVLSQYSFISYSNNSSTDQVVFRIDQNGSILWTTVLDFQFGYDSACKMTSYGSTLYSGMYASLLYP